MNIVVIHGSNQGFFPRFYVTLEEATVNAGDTPYLFLPNTGTNRRNSFKGMHLFGSPLIWHLHYRLYKLTGLQDCFSFFDTLHLIHRLKQLSPDIIHLHVVNSWVLNFPLFVKYVNKKNIPVVWTFHDCRAFTGRCAYFDEIGCERWKAGCGKCPQKELYNPTIIDASAKVWKFRKKWITNIKDLHIVTPSQWLADYVRLSFLKDIDTRVIYNGVDIFKFRQCQSDIWKDDYGVRGKKIVLGVAASWETRKGFEYFEQISQRLPEDYSVVLVGRLPRKSDKIINVPPIKDTNKLVSMFQYSDVFCNPTLADNFPTTNIESLASGTPVVTFKTGGSAEAIDETCGVAVEKGNTEQLLQAIMEVAENKEKYSPVNCMKRAKKFSNKQYDKYVELYREIKKEGGNDRKIEQSFFRSENPTIGVNV